jgi:ubiquinone/menaquinone biosynthesis C-methylase UbiE
MYAIKAKVSMIMNGKEYVHGYSEREQVRLTDQANTLAELLHHDTIFPAGSRVLEAGCAVGATTLVIAKKNPDVRFVSVDISEESLSRAAELMQRENVRNVEFARADIFNLIYPDNSFDHGFACFLLEHLGEPVRALSSLMRVIKPGGSITSIEGDHGSVFFYPHSTEAHKAIRCQIDIQASYGGNSEIGRELFPLLRKAGYENVRVSPRMVYVDSSRPGLVEGFTKNTFTAMIEGVRNDAISRKLSCEADFDKGIRDLYRAAEDDGVFCYTFFKGIGFKSRSE